MRKLPKFYAITKLKLKESLRLSCLNSLDAVSKSICNKACKNDYQNLNYVPKETGGKEVQEVDVERLQQVVTTPLSIVHSFIILVISALKYSFSMTHLSAGTPIAWV